MIEFPRIELERTSVASDLLTLAKAHLRITGTAEDTELTRYINAAARDWEDATRRLLVAKTVKEYFDEWPWTWCETVYLQRAPVTSVTSVKYYNTSDVLTTWDSSNYDTDLVGEPARIKLAENASLTAPSVDDRTNSVIIEYESGVAADAASLDAQTVNAILGRAAWFYGQGRELADTHDIEAVNRC